MRAADHLLNAAAVSWERLEHAYRFATPDSRLQTYGTNPTHFWQRQWDALGARPTPLPPEWFGVGARVPMQLAQARAYAGDLDRAAYNGLLLDDSKDGTTVTGWPGGDRQNTSARTARRRSGAWTGWRW